MEPSKTQIALQALVDLESNAHHARTTLREALAEHVIEITTDAAVCARLTERHGELLAEASRRVGEGSPWQADSLVEDAKALRHAAMILRRYEGDQSIREVVDQDIPF